MSTNCDINHIVPSTSVLMTTPSSTPISHVETFPFPATPNSRLTDDSYSVEQSLKFNQYIPITKITQTLQGSIWKVNKNENTYIVKVTNKLLHKKHSTNLNGKQIHISENIIQEATILKYLTYNSPKSLKYFTNLDLLVMQYSNIYALDDDLY
eukprot:331675_1